jgi:hypothetical protein
MKRSCSANCCSTSVSASKGMCALHWLMVPLPIQKRIYAAYRANPTREQRLNSIEFLEAWAAAVESVAGREGMAPGNSYRRLADHVKERQHGEAGAV